MDSARAVVRPVTPVADERAASGVGRSARLDLVFEHRAGRTQLAHAYAEPPFRVGRVLVHRDGAHLILATVGPGIFGGDVLRQSIHVGPGASVRLTSQSAPQIRSSRDGLGSSLHTTITVDDHGELRCVWDPLIPFAGARFSQHIDIQLAEEARLFWSDASMSGRIAHGERWAFAELSHVLAVSRLKTPEYIERYRIEPGSSSPVRPWIAADCNYFGSVLASGWPIDSAWAVSLHDQLARIDGVRAAADRLGDRLLLVRLLATAGVPFHAARCLISNTMDPRSSETGTAARSGSTLDVGHPVNPAYGKNDAADAGAIK